MTVRIPATGEFTERLRGVRLCYAAQKYACEEPEGSGGSASPSCVCTPARTLQTPGRSASQRVRR